MITENRGIAVAMLLFAVGLGAQAQVGWSATDSPFRVEEPNLDIGRVIAGKTAVGTFVFHNDSEKDVRILRAKPS